MELRRLTPADDEDLLGLHRSCPIEADFTFFFDRGPRFFAWPEAVFEDHAYLGGLEGGRLVAAAMLATCAGGERRERGVRPFSYAGDARVLPAVRRQGFARRAAAALAATAPGLAASGVAVALVKRGNAAGGAVVDSLRLPGLAVSRLCGFEAVSLLLVRPPPAPIRCRVRRARAEDLAVVSELAARASRGRPLALPAGEEALRRDLARLPGLAIDDFYLAFDGDEPVGALGAWDGDALRRVAVLRYSLRAQLARAGWAVARRLRPGVAPLPAAGGSFRAITLTRLAVPSGDPAVLHDLLAAVCTDRMGQGFHMVHLGLAAGDPLLAGVRGFARQRFASELLVAATPAGERWARQGLPMLDLRYV